MSEEAAAITKMDTAGVIRIKHKTERVLEPCNCPCSGDLACRKNYCPCRKMGYYCGSACKCQCKNCANSPYYEPTTNSRNENKRVKKKQKVVDTNDTLSDSEIAYFESLLVDVDVEVLLDGCTDLLNVPVPTNDVSR